MPAHDTPDLPAREHENNEPQQKRRLTRRDFLRRSALTVGGAIAAGGLLSEQKSAHAAPTGQNPTPVPTRSPIGGNMLPPNMDATSNPYSTKRHSVVAPRGVVATSQPLAVKAGLKMLELGGNAVDAAIATAIALTVVEPTSNGIGADAFALVWDGKKLSGLNGSGRAPSGLTMDLVRHKGNTTMPQKGWLSVTVPGAPALWRDLHARFGKLPFASLFEPAILFAAGGYPVSPIVAYYWDRSVPIYTGLAGAQYKGWEPLFAPGGHAPRSGEKWSSADHAATLRRIASSNSDDFYKGQTAEAIVKFAQQTGGVITAADLANHTSTWVDPISTSYRGYDVWEIPPNGQGIVALTGLNILEGFNLGESQRDSATSFHLQIESLKLAFADGFRYVADPDFEQIPVEGLLDKKYAEKRRALIGNKALQPAPGDPNSGGTVYLCAADSDGMMVSFIQSNYAGFGSGVVVPGTGVALQNRGGNFNLDPNHPNHLEPGKRPYHTIIPGFLTKGGEAVGPFGVMGGFMQPQGHMQMIANTIDYAMNPQASLDAPRWQWIEGKTVQIESDAHSSILSGLRAMGHQVEAVAPGGAFGRGQIIWRLPSGEYLAGSDKRADGYAGSL